MQFPMLIQRGAARPSVSVLLSLAAIATPLAAEPTLAVGQPARGVWQAGAPLRYTPSLQAGDVVRGVLVLVGTRLPRRTSRRGSRNG